MTTPTTFLNQWIPNHMALLLQQREIGKRRKFTLTSKSKKLGLSSYHSFKKAVFKSKVRQISKDPPSTWKKPEVSNSKNQWQTEGQNKWDPNSNNATIFIKESPDADSSGMHFK